MRYILILALLAGCASPHQKVTGMDTASAKYASPECAAARKAALEYDENVPLRMGIGIGSVLVLGPAGILLAAFADASQAEKRKAMIAELERACG